jgi:hypothetical protein
MIRRLLCLVLLLLLAGCVRAVPQTTLSSVRSIGVVSALPEEIVVKRVGLTVFGNAEATIPAPSWGINDYIEDRMIARLAPRHEAKRVAVRRENLTLDKVSYGAVSLGGRRPFEEVVRGEVGTTGLDAYLVVMPRTTGYGTTNQRIAGLGIVSGGGGLVARRQDIFALYELIVIDGRTWSIVGQANAPRSGGMFEMIQGPFRGVDASFVPANAAAPTDAETARLRRAITSLIDESLPSTLAAAGFQ